MYFKFIFLIVLLFFSFLISSCNNEGSIEYSKAIKVKDSLKETTYKQNAHLKGQDTIYLKCIDGKNRAFGIHYPNSVIKKETLYPAIVWLHGGVNGTKQNRGSQVAQYFAKQSDSLGFIFSAVSGEQGATWYDGNGISNINLAVSYLLSTGLVDPQRIILAGVSDGGNGTWLASMHYPNNFAGFMIFSGSFNILARIGIPIITENMISKPHFVIHGGKDRLYPKHNVISSISNLKSLGINIDFKFIKDATHGLDYMKEKESEVFEFLFKTKKESWPKEISFSPQYNGDRRDWLQIDSLNSSKAKISANISKNIITIETAHITKITIYLGNEIFNLANNIIINSNKIQVFNKKAKLNKDSIIQSFNKLGNRKFIPLSSLTLEL